MHDIHDVITEFRSSSRPGVVVTVVAREGHVPTEVQCKMLVDAGGRVAGTVGGGAIEKMALDDAATVLDAGKPVLKEYLLDESPTDPRGTAQPTGMVCGGRVTLFYEVLRPGDRAYLIGAGHVNRALQNFLQPLGFEVVFVDYRPEQLADLPAGHLQAVDDYATLPELPHLADAYVVVATHSHHCDESVLAQLLQGPRPRYLGVVASRRKREQMTENLRARLGDTLDLGWVRMPVGLKLGGRGPADLALSIAAEMQMCRHELTTPEAMS